ncbi:MAG TPA: nitroreductase family protein [Myxococcota bacterium]|nr:nitroreductase family protein [Myxococcota bacterium]HQK51521.1 nitroreductase family protein [Myxococcota bacterium]
MTVREILRIRRTVQAFEPEGLLLDRQTLEDLVQEASLSPSDHNLQPWRFLIIRDRARKEDLYLCTGRSRKVREASALILVCGDLQADREALREAERQVQAGERTPEDLGALRERLASVLPPDRSADRMMLAVRDASMAAMALLLVATERGLGTALIGSLDESALRWTFHIPDRYVPVVVLALGLPALDHPPLEPRRRFPLHRIVFHEDMGAAEP